MALTTVNDVKQMLRWQQGEEAKYTAQLALYIAAAEQIIEGEIGPIAPQTLTYRADGGPSVRLPHRVNAVTGVTVDGVAVTGYTVNLRAGIVRGWFTPGHQNVVVTYTTGFASVPEAIKLAATMIVVDKWAIASQRAPGLDDQVDPAYLMPKAVRDLLAPYKATTMPGFA